MAFRPKFAQRGNECGVSREKQGGVSQKDEKYDALMGVGGSTLNEVWGEEKRRSLH